jgi:hypothetical protein
VAVNSWGATVRPDCGRFWAADLVLSGEIDPQPAIPEASLDPEDFSGCGAAAPGANTTIAVVAADAPLDKRGCRRLAIMAQDGLARAIRPAHTPFDGDTVFALATGSGPAVGPADLLTRCSHWRPAADRRSGRPTCSQSAMRPPTASLGPLCGRCSPPSRWAGFSAGSSDGGEGQLDSG